MVIVWTLALCVVRTKILYFFMTSSDYKTSQMHLRWRKKKIGNEKSTVNHSLVSGIVECGSDTTTCTTTIYMECVGNKCHTLLRALDSHTLQSSDKTLCVDLTFHRIYTVSVQCSFINDKTVTGKKMKKRKKNVAGKWELNKCIRFTCEKCIQTKNKEAKNCE